MIYIQQYFVYYVEKLRKSLNIFEIRGAGMILPLERLIAYDGNVYELTCAAIRRAAQITLAGDEDITDDEGKVVSTALKQILTKKVEYRIDQQS